MSPNARSLPRHDACEKLNRLPCADAISTHRPRGADRRPARLNQPARPNRLVRPDAIGPRAEPRGSTGLKGLLTSAVPLTRGPYYRPGARPPGRHAFTPMYIHLTTPMPATPQAPIGWP